MNLSENVSGYRPWHTVPHNGDDAYHQKASLAEEGLWNITDVQAEVQNGGVLILPFLSEPGSALCVAQSWNKMTLDPSQHGDKQYSILPISASSCLKTETELSRSGFPIYQQNELLRAINWQDLVRNGIIPALALDPDGLPKGRKGRTMLAGTLLALRKNPLWIMFHDSDVINPMDYGAIKAIPQLLGSDKGYNACMMALVGSERHNEQWTAHTNIVALSSMYDEPVKKLATRLGRIVWPLSGERGFSAQWLRKLPFCLGMGIETIFNVASCEKELTDNCTYIQQVLGTVSKEERGICNVSITFGIPNPLFPPSLLGIHTRRISPGT
jgi:hypothetical protein